MKPWLNVVGLGEDGLAGLSPAARVLIDTAEVLVGGRRHLALIGADHPAERRTWRTPIRETVADLRQLAGRRVTVLATGDPMHFGIGVTLARAFGPEALTIVPAPGAFSLAAARLGWPVADVACLTLHGRPLEKLYLCVYPGARLLVLSDDGSTPSRVADALVQRGYPDSRMTVLEHMGGPRENRHESTAATWNGRVCADLNTVAVACVAGSDAVVLSRVAGLPDEMFVNDGQLTKREVRAVTLAQLGPQPGDLLWDVGAGSGSVAIEWMRLGGRAVAVERDAARCAAIAQNAAALGTPELQVVKGEAPAALDGLEQPAAVFLGGGLTSGGPDGAGLAERCWSALPVRGRMVANAVTVEGEARVAGLADRFGGTLTRLAVARAEPVGNLRGWRAAMPVTQWSATKP